MPLTNENMLSIAGPCGETFYYRNISGDHYSVRENLLHRNPYYARLPISESDIVLDLGAHIGSFAVFAAAIAKEVVAVEAHPANYDILCRNTAHISHITAIYGAAVAVVGSKFVTLWESAGRDQGIHSVLEFRGRVPILVPEVSLQYLYAIRQPTYVKMDVEGAEYELINVPMPPSVQRCIIETHFRKRAKMKEMPHIVDTLKSQGFEVFVPPYSDKRWAIYITATREAPA